MAIGGNYSYILEENGTLYSWGDDTHDKIGRIVNNDNPNNTPKKWNSQQK
ncbi:MAG: hypothetical protein ACMUEM_01295 [Flavobacteriales bacterium AspAUS03]